MIPEGEKRENTILTVEMLAIKKQTYSVTQRPLEIHSTDPPTWAPKVSSAGLFQIL